MSIISDLLRCAPTVDELAKPVLRQCGIGWPLTSRILRGSPATASVTPAWHSTIRNPAVSASRKAARGIAAATCGESSHRRAHPTSECGRFWIKHERLDFPRSRQFVEGNPRDRFRSRLRPGSKPPHSLLQPILGPVCRGKRRRGVGASTPVWTACDGRRAHAAEAIF